MTPNQALRLFGSKVAIARICGVRAPSVSEWFASGKIPQLRQYQLQIATEGKLKARKARGRK